MILSPLPAPLQEVCDLTVRRLRETYEFNARRHEPANGDDAVTFGISVYRNSWAVIERDVTELQGWSASRPEGSLVVAGWARRLHIYRFGDDERVDLERFRLDEAGASATKKHIARTNAHQLTLDLGPSVAPLREPSDGPSELVIVHAGNPTDGCCAVWIGAPIPTDEILSSPWMALEPLWVIDRCGSAASDQDRQNVVRHDEMAEPEVNVELRVEEAGPRKLA